MIDIEIQNVSYRYPFQDKVALEDISLKIPAGSGVLLAGASGGGKSTLLRLINGLIPHLHGGQLSGQVILGPRSTTQSCIADISTRVSTLHQDPEKQFLALTVADELSFALEWRISDPAEIRRRTQQAIEDFHLQEILNSSVYSLSEGQKQKLALASLAVLQPQVLVLDEPTGNLDPQSAIELAGHLKRLKDSGTTLIIADHRLAWLPGLIDSVYVVNHARIVASGDFSLLEDDELRRRHSLRAIELPQEIDIPECESSCRDALVNWQNLCFGYRGKRRIFDGDNIAIPRGSVTAMVGPNGCGKTTFAKLMAGLLKPTGGLLTRGGQKIKPAEMLKTTAMAVQNSELQLYQPTAIKELTHAIGKRSRRLSKTEALEYLTRFGLESVADRHPQSLSGGQKQRLVVACAAARAQELLILDEPTSGLDAGQMHALAKLLAERSAEGKTTLVITHDLELIETVCTHRLTLPLGQKQAAAI